MRKVWGSSAGHSGNAEFKREVAAAISRLEFSQPVNLLDVDKSHYAVSPKTLPTGLESIKAVELQSTLHTRFA